MRSIALGAMLLAACLGERTTACPETGYVCPDNLACAPAPVYCAKQEQLDACTGKQQFDTCPYSKTEDGACYASVCFACDNDREGCGPAGWYTMTPAGVALNGVWVAARGDAYAVGDNETVLHYDGIAWSAVTVPPTSGTVVLRAVWGTSSSDVFAVGDSGTVLHFDGMTWTLDVSTAADLYGVWGSGPHDVYAVGYTRFPTTAVVQHYDGSAWTTILPGMATPLFAVGGSGSGDVRVAGNNGVVMAPDGMQLASVGVPVRSIWARAAGDFLYGGGAGAPMIDHGTTTASIVGCGGQIQAIWGSGAQLLAAGTGACLLGSSDADVWNAIAPAPGAGNPDLHALSGSGLDDVFAVGAAGAIWHSRGL